MQINKYSPTLIKIYTFFLLIFIKKIMEIKITNKNFTNLLKLTYRKNKEIF